MVALMIFFTIKESFQDKHVLELVAGLINFWANLLW